MGWEICPMSTNFLSVLNVITGRFFLKSLIDGCNDKRHFVTIYGSFSNNLTVNFSLFMWETKILLTHLFSLIVWESINLLAQAKTCSWNQTVLAMSVFSCLWKERLVLDGIRTHTDNDPYISSVICLPSSHATTHP
jgi:hypothetical protein